MHRCMRCRSPARSSSSPCSTWTQRHCPAGRRCRCCSWSCHTSGRCRMHQTWGQRRHRRSHRRMWRLRCAVCHQQAGTKRQARGGRVGAKNVHAELPAAAPCSTPAHPPGSTMRPQPPRWRWQSPWAGRPCWAPCCCRLRTRPQDRPRGWCSWCRPGSAPAGRGKCSGCRVHTRPTAQSGAGHAPAGVQERTWQQSGAAAASVLPAMLMEVEDEL